MILHDDQPRARGSAARLQETLRGSRSSLPSQVFIVALAAAAVTAAAIDDRFRMNCSKVAPSNQFLHTDSSIFDTNDGVKVGATYEATDEKISKVDGFISQTGETAEMRKATYEESEGWYAGITADMFG